MMNADSSSDVSSTTGECFCCTWEVEVIVESNIVMFMKLCWLTCCCRTTLGGGGTAMLAMNMSMSSDLRWRSAAKEGPPGSLLSTRSGMVRLFKLVSSSSSPSQLAVLFDDAAPLYLTAP